MNSIAAGPISVEFDAGEQACAELAVEASKRTIELVSSLWGLSAPPRCRVVVVSDWLAFLRDNRPGGYLRWLCLPCMPRQGGATDWSRTDSLVMRQRKSPTLGVLTTRELSNVSNPLRERLMLPEADVQTRLAHLVCQGLTHLCATAARVPWWLAQGLAMSTVDAFHGAAAARPGTLEYMRRRWFRCVPIERWEISRMRPEEAVYHSVRGYWITRYLQAVQPLFLRTELTRGASPRSLESAIAGAFGKKLPQFWYDVDQIITSHYDVAMFVR